MFFLLLKRKVNFSLHTSTILLVALFGQITINAQDAKNFQKGEEKIIKRKGQNLVAYDDKKLHYGFFIAFNRSTFRTKPSQFFNDQVMGDTLPLRAIAINPRQFVGFTTGFILNVRLHDFFDFRLLPTVSFYSRYMDFRLKPPNSSRMDSVVTELRQSTFSFVEMAFLLKYKSVRRNNTRMYVLGGVRPGIEVGAKRKELGDDRLRSKTLDFQVEYGFGFDFYYPLFKLSPEIRFSHGLINMRNKDPNIFAQSIQRMNTHTITLYFNFE
jgi:hypothetical protein